MSSAGCEVVISVKERQPFVVEKTMRLEAVERLGEKAGIPAVEEVAGDREVGRIATGDVSQLTIEPGHIAGVSQVEIREMGDEHISECSGQSFLSSGYKGAAESSSSYRLGVS